MNLVERFEMMIWTYRWRIIAGFLITSFLYGIPQMWAMVLFVSIAGYDEFYQKKPQPDLEQNGKNVTEPTVQEVTEQEQEDESSGSFFESEDARRLLDLFIYPQYPPNFDRDFEWDVKVKYEDVNIEEVDFENIDFDDIFVEPYGNYPIRPKDQLVLESLPVEDQRSLHVCKMDDYYGRDTLLVGQTPVPKLYEKYWEAIWQEKVGIVVWIGDPNDFSAMWLSVRPYISSTPGAILQFGRYRHECLVATHSGLNPEPGINMSVGTVERTEDDGRKQKREIVLVQLWNWPKDEAKPRDILEVAKIIDFVVERRKIARRSNSVGGVFVHCSDGIMRAPSFIVCYMNCQMIAGGETSNVSGVVGYFHRHYYRPWRTTDLLLAVTHFKLQYVIVAVCFDLFKCKKGDITDPDYLSKFVNCWKYLEKPKAAPPGRIASMPDMYGDQIFVTRAPVPNEFIEQLETIWDNRVAVVVWLGDVPNPYMPTTRGQRMRFGEFDQQCLTKCIDNAVIVSIERTDSQWGKKKKREIYLVHGIDWPERAAPTNSRIVAKVSSMVYVMHLNSRHNGLPGVLMQCSDGVQRTPTFLACYLGWSPLRKTGKYNVVEIAANVRKNIPGAWTIDPAASNSVSTVFDQHVTLYKIFRSCLECAKKSGMMRIQGPFVYG